MEHGNERVVSGLITHKDMARCKEAVCVQVEKIYDSCKEKDCVENARVRFDDLTPYERDIINNAFNVKIRKAVVKNVITDIEPVPFKRGFYTVDIKYIIKVWLEFYTREEGRINVDTIKGLVTFDKKVILFGSEGKVKIFKSHFEENELDKPIRSSLQQDNLPIAKVEVADPIPLNAQIRGLLDKFFEDKDRCEQEEDARILPTKRVFVTIGLFSIIKLARFVQLLIPAFDFCIPIKECVASTDENPCELFEAIEFPFDEFFPPQIMDFPGAAEQEAALLGESIHEHKKHHKHDNDDD